MEIDSHVEKDSVLKEQTKDSTKEKESSVGETNKKDMPINDDKNRTKKDQDSTDIIKMPSIGSKPTYSKELSSAEGQIPRTGPKLIEPMPLPHRKAFHRGISATTIDNLSRKKITKKITEAHSNQSKSTSISKLEKMKQNSKEEVYSERRSQLRNIAARLNDKITVTKNLDTAPVGKMKSSV